jgi:hypothetical protein
MIALTFVMAPLPNSICSRCGNAGDYSETNSAYIDFGRFLTGMFVVSPFYPIPFEEKNIGNEKLMIR